MMIDFTHALKTISGEPLFEEEQPVTLASIAVNALLGAHPDENPSGEEKARRWKLAQAIYDGANAITPEDAVLLRKLIGMAFVPLVVGQAYELLN